MVKYLQLIPDFKGKKRLSKYILDLFYDSKKSVKVDCKNGLSFVLPNTVENVGFEVLINGSYEQEMVDFIIENLPNGAGFLDIGANIGWYTFCVAS